MKRLDRYDKLRLAELVDTYLGLTSEYTISSNGEIDYSKDSFIIRLFKGLEASKMDFLTVVHLLSEKIMKGNEANQNTMYLCGRALGILIDSNNRPEVIKSLYAAFLLKDILIANSKKGQQAENRPLTIDKIERVTRQEIIPAKFERIPSSNDMIRSLSNDVANILNDKRENGAIIVIND